MGFAIPPEPMAVVEIIDKLLGVSGSEIQLKVFECADCGAEFESAKQPERASCPECLSNDVNRIGTVDR